MHRPGRIFACLAIAIAIGLASPSAVAAPPPPSAAPRTAAERAAMAEALFDQGRRLMAAGRFAEACPKFVESERIDHGVGTLLNLADCFEQNGQTASAWAGFHAAAAAASAEGQTPRERVARERERRLVPLLSRLTIRVPHPLASPGLVIKRDDLAIEPSLWGVAVPVDPGEHTIVVSAPGKRASSRIVSVPRAAGASITTTVDDLDDLPPADPCLAASSSSSRARPKSLSGQQIAGIAVGGAGVAAILAGSVLGARALDRNADAAARCHGDLCDVQGVALRHDARALGTASTAALLAGGAAILGGAALYWTAPPSAQDRPRTSAGVSVGPAGAGFFMGATW